MNSKIKQALVILLNEEVRIASWGLSNISITETSIMFDVDGFIYSGRIIIKSCKKTSYQITFNDGSTETCSLRNLVNVLDSKIEITANYLQKLPQWLFDKKVN